MKHLKSWSLKDKRTPAWSPLKDSKKKFFVERPMTRGKIYEIIVNHLDIDFEQEQKIQLAEALSSDVLCQKFIKGYFELQDELKERGELASEIGADELTDEETHDAYSVYVAEFMTNL